MADAQKDLLDFPGSLNERGLGFVSLTVATDATKTFGRYLFQRNGLRQHLKRLGEIYP